jgi:predicted membrane channel-forming protein YqfA (hemolysin III family)
MMPAAGPPPMTFFIYSIVFAFITGLIFAGVYARISSALKSSGVQKGLRYGIGLFLVAGIPFFLTITLLINIPLALSVIWLVSNLVVYLIGGIAIAKIVK